MAPQFSTTAILALLATLVAGVVIMVRRYPDGINNADGLPSFSRTFMVCSACFGAIMTVYLVLVFTGAITFA